MEIVAVIKKIFSHRNQINPYKGLHLVTELATEIKSVAIKVSI